MSMIDWKLGHRLSGSSTYLGSSFMSAGEPGYLSSSTRTGPHCGKVQRDLNEAITGGWKMLISFCLLESHHLSLQNYTDVRLRSKIHMVELTNLVYFRGDK